MFSQFQHAAVDYAANAPKSTNIPAGGIMNELILDLSAAPTVTLANNTAANTKRGDLWGAIASLQLKGEGALPYLDLPGNVLPMISYFMDYGIPLDPQTTLADGATANPSLRQTIIVPLWSTRAGKPFDTALDNTAEPNGLTLTVNWADHLKVNGLATGFTTNPALNVFTLESPANDHPFLRKRRYMAQATFNATGMQRLTLEPGSSYRRFLINTRDGSDVDQATRFSQLNFYVGGQLRQTTSESVLRQAMRLRAGLKFGDTVFKNTTENLAAWYLNEQAIDGYLSHAADTAQRQGNYLEFNITTAPTTVCVVYEVLDDLRRPEFQTRPVRAA